MNLFLRLFFCPLIFSFTILYAQETGKISGKVTDAKDNSGVEADVKLFAVVDSLVKAGAKCNSDGSFFISGIPYGTYRLEVRFIGYSLLNVDNVNLSAASSSLTFDSLKLKKQDITTEEINVEENKSLIEFNGDKKVFNVDQSILTKGGTALDVLKKVPMVDVDINDNVSLRGSQNVKILIDDKPSRFASLKQVPADAIEKVELITNPPAKYEAEGVTGIINIVMKKSNKLGFTGNLSLGGNYTNTLSGWGGLDINLKKKQTTFFGGFYTGNWNNVFSYTNNTQYFSPVSTFESGGSGKNHGYWIWGQGGMEYEFSPGKTLGFEASIGTGQWFNSDTSLSQSLNNLGSLSSFYTQDNNRNGLWQNITADLYYNSKLDDKGRELNADLSISRNRNEFKLGLVKKDYDSLSVPVNNTPLDQRDTTLNKSYNINAQADYT